MLFSPKFIRLFRVISPSHRSKFVASKIDNALVSCVVIYSEVQQWWVEFEKMENARQVISIFNPSVLLIDVGSVLTPQLTNAQLMQVHEIF